MMSMFKQDLRNVLQSPALVLFINILTIYTSNETHLLALTGDKIEFEVRHQEPTSWEYPFRTLVVLLSVTVIVK